VLEAMGIAPGLSQGALRVSLGWDTTQADVEKFLNIWTRLVARHKTRKAA
jgi:cysteine desulfurase